MSKWKTVNSAEEAEAQDLEAAHDAVSQESEKDEAYQDTGSEDLSALFDDEFGDGPDESSGPPPSSRAPVDSDESQEEPEEEEPVAELPDDEDEEEPSESQEPEAPKPSVEVPQEDLLEILRQAQAEVAKYRAEADKSQETKAQVADQTSVQDQEAVRTAALEHLERNVYQVSQEDADLMLTSPEQVMPRLMARAHVQMMENVAQMVRASLPGLIRTTVDRETSEKSWEDKFFAEWPTLKDHRDEVLKMREAHQNNYPDTNEDRRMKEVGGFLALRHGLVPQKPAAAKQKPKPHQPIGRGPTNTRRPAPQKNFFEMLAEEELADDLG